MRVRKEGGDEASWIWKCIKRWWKMDGWRTVKLGK